MRVLHVYSGNLYGGIETLLVTLARCRALSPEMEPHFALCFEGRLSKELEAAGVRHHLLGEVHARQPLSVWRGRRALTGLLEHETFDVVVCHAPWPQAIFGPVIRKLGLPLIFWMHGPASGRHWSERWARFTKPDLVICNSRFTASTLSTLYPNALSQVLYYPVAFQQSHYSLAERNSVRAELDTPENATVIVQVSRVETLKGHKVHLQALSKLSDLPEWMCWLVGGAQQEAEILYYAELKSLAVSLGITDRVRFVGERSDVARLVRASDIYCQPNIHPEAFGISFIEALEATLPIVTTEIGGACEIVNEFTGVLVPPSNEDKLAEALRELIVDPTRRARLGAAGPARARELCDPETQMNRLFRLLTSVINQEVAA